MLARHDWDTVQMPVNVLDHHYRSFARHVLPAAAKKGTAVIGMKSLGGGKAGQGRLVTHGVCSPEEGIRWALSQPIASLVVGIDSTEILQQDLRIGQGFQPMPAEEQAALLARVKEAAGDGRHELFKSTMQHDGPFHRAQHGMTEAEVAAL